MGALDTASDSLLRRLVRRLLVPMVSDGCGVCCCSGSPPPFKTSADGGVFLIVVSSPSSSS